VSQLKSEGINKKSWTQGLNQEEEFNVRGNYKESLVIRKRLQDVLEDKINNNISSTRSKLTYDKANWVYEQADANGYQRALNEIIELIN